MPRLTRLLAQLQRAAPLLLLIAGILVVICEDAFGRAGGGGGYGGGRGGGGSGGGRGGGGGGGSGGGDIGLIIYWLFRLCIEQPYFGIPLVALIIYAVYTAAQQGNEGYRGMVIRRGTHAHNFNQAVDGINTLKKADPQFSPEVFYARVRNAFHQIQDAWCSQHLEKVRPFISDSIHERFTLQLDEQRQRRFRDHMENINVSMLRIAEVSSDNVFDVVTVYIAASASDYRVSLDTGKPLTQRSPVQEFGEYWSFLRRRGAKTLTGKPGLIEGNCPNCAAPIEMNQSANCANCKALLRSGEYDWVLSEITQETEWQPSSTQNIPGVPELAQRDPGFNLQHLEDRASVMFWRWAMAQRTGKLAPLQKIASPNFASEFSTYLKNPGRPTYSDCAVGAVISLGILSGEQDRAAVEIRWSGKRVTTSGTGDSVLFTTLFVLSRDPSALSDPGKSISSAHCMNCGAPESTSASNNCDFCGAVQNDGKLDWVLSEMMPRNSPAAQDLIGSISAVKEPAQQDPEELGPPDIAGNLAWMIKIVCADGQIDERERKMIHRLAQRRRVPLEDVDTMLNAALHKDIDIEEPGSKEEAKVWLSAMISAAMADGKVDGSESRLLQAAGTRAGLVAFEIQYMIAQEKNRRYQFSREQLKRRKQIRRETGYNPLDSGAGI
jgi:tellurite resistance protein